MLRQNAIFSSATQQITPPEVGGKSRGECLNTKLPLPYSATRVVQRETETYCYTLGRHKINLVYKVVISNY